MRKTHTLIGLLICVCFALHSSATVLGIDFGSKFIKIASVRSNTPFHIVVDEETSRKIVNALAIINGEREFGNHAKNRFIRKPADSYLWASYMLGRGIDSENVNTVRAEKYGFDIVESEREDGAFGISFKGSSDQYTPDEFVAMMFEYIMKIAADDADSPVKDCVITVPLFSTQNERRALLTAAQIAGLNVLSLIDENTAVGVQYGIDRKYDGQETDNQRIAIYNMGARFTQVSIIEYSSYTKHISKKNNKTIGQLEVKGTGYDSSLGGQDFTNVIVNDMRDLAQKAHEDVLSESKRVNAKLQAAAEKVKLVLSANTDAFHFVEALYNEKDFKYSLSRKDYYDMDATSALLERVATPLEHALENANMTLSDLDSVVIFGGGLRIPGVQERLRAFTGDIELSSGINGDEAACMGAVLRAANMSTTFKVRKFGLTDVLQKPISVNVFDSSAMDESGEFLPELNAQLEEDNTNNDIFFKEAALFRQHNKLSKKRTIAFRHNKDFYVNVQYEDTENLPNDITQVFLKYNVTGVEKMLSKDEYAELIVDQDPRISLTFSVDASGIVTLAKAEATLEEMKEIAVPKKKPVPTPVEDLTEENSDPKAGEESAEIASDSTVSEDNTENVSSDEETSGTESNNDETEREEEEKVTTEEELEEETEPEVEYVMKKITHRASLRMVPITSDISPRVLTQSEKQVVLSKLASLKAADERRRKTAFAKNELEAHIFSTRNSLYDEEVEEVSTEEEIEKLAVLLREAEDWLYEQNDKDENIIEAYTNKLASLQAVSDPIFLRVKEMVARPEAVESARSLVNYTNTLLASWVEEKPWLPEKETGKLKNMTIALEEWLNEVETAQSEKELTEPAAFVSSQVNTRLKGIAKLVQDLLSRRKPYVPPPKDEKEKSKKRKMRKGKKEKDVEEENMEEQPDIVDSEETDTETKEESEVPAMKDEL